MNELASVASELDDGLVIARVVGEIDLSNSREVEREIADGVPNTADGMIIDLKEVTYLDSAGIRCLISLATRFGWRDQGLGVVTAAGSSIERVLSIAGTEQVLKVFGSVKAARAALDGR